MKLLHKSILIISPESWGPNHVSKHHYALELSKNNQVYFLNPPSSRNNISNINGNLTIIDYKPRVRGVNRLPKFLRDFFNSITINTIKKLGNFNTLDIAWSFDPFRFQNLNLFQADLKIYHPVDVHYTHLEREIANTADIIFTTCEIIIDRLKKFNSRIFNIGHGLAESFLSIKKQTKKKGQPVKACMMGNLQRKIDFPLLYKLIEKNKDVEFHFIGPTQSSNLSNNNKQDNEIKTLGSFQNTKLYGTVSQSALPETLSLMDIFLILYSENENLASRSNPHKLLEFLATGKVVLSYFLIEYIDNEDFLVMVKENEDIVNKFTEIISNLTHYNHPDEMKRRMDYAKRNLYEEKIKEIEDYIA